MPLRRRKVTGTDLLLLVLCVVVSAWPLVEGSIAPGSYVPALLLGAAAGIGTAVVIRLRPKLWWVAPIAPVGATFLGAAIAGRPEWVYVWGFVAAGTFAGRILLPPPGREES